MKIVGIDGKELDSESFRKEAEEAKKKAEEIEYSAGGASLMSSLSPAELLEKALEGAKQFFTSHAYTNAKNSGMSESLARAEAMSVRESISNPFYMEPAALSVFMQLSREIEYRDSVIDEINERLIALGAEPLSLNGRWIKTKEDRKAESGET